MHRLTAFLIHIHISLNIFAFSSGTPVLIPLILRCCQNALSHIASENLTSVPMLLKDDWYYQHEWVSDLGLRVTNLNIVILKLILMISLHWDIEALQCFISVLLCYPLNVCLCIHWLHHLLDPSLLLHTKNNPNAIHHYCLGFPPEIFFFFLIFRF